METMKCRICFEKQEDNSKCLNIYQEDCKLNIPEIIEQHLGFRPLIHDDRVSKIICELCWSKLSEFHEFYIKVNDVQSAFNLTHEKLYCALLPEAEILLVSTIKEEPTTIADSGFLLSETIDKALEEATDDNCIANPLNIGCDDEKIALDIFTNDCFNDNLSDNDDTCDEEDAKDEEENCDDFFQSTSRDSSKSSVKATTTRSKRTRLSSNRNSTQTAKESPKKQRREKAAKATNAYNATDEELIRKHIPFNCGVCGDNVKDFPELKVHFTEKHSEQERAFIRCCGRKISCIQRNYLIQHAYRHENPEHFKCRECRKVFADNDGLRAHIIANHPSEDDLKYPCDQCDKRFAKQSLLSWHKASHMPENERKFICTRCPEPKAFANNRLLSTHTFNAHKRPKNVCHICAKVIADKAFFEKHVRSHTEQNQPRIQCPMPDCQSWLKDSYSLKEHMRRHEDQGKIFECELCGKRSTNRKALRSHVRNTHSSKVFHCDHCPKTFKSALSVKEHMAHHTGESLYKCPFCKRNFNSKANMHSHKKKMHPEEWAFWRKAKLNNTQPSSLNPPNSTDEPLTTNFIPTTENFLC